MRKFGLAAILSFVDKGATAAMGRVGRKAKTLQDRFRGIGRGVKQMGRGLSGIAIGAAPVAAAFGLMIKKGAEFEQSIANLRAVSLDIHNKTTPRLEGLAKTLGATTVFSATQAADAMTALKRAGLTVDQVAGAVGGTLNAAAAEGIGLADAASLVADNMKAFGIEAEQAAAVAGTLALASARTNTNMMGLQEGLKLAAPAAGLVNASLADTTAVLGALADIGLKGTLSGTAFRAAMFKLINPTKAGRKAIGQLGIKFGDLTKMLDKGDVVGTFRTIVERLRKVPSRAKAAGIAAKIFGLRGVAMTKALDLSGTAADRFNETLSLLRKETGKTAEAMAEIQLKTLTGQVTLLKSAFEGVSIELFGLISGETAGVVKSMAKTMGQLAFAMRVVSGQKLFEPKDLIQLANTPAAIFEVARGIRDAFKDIKEVVGGLIETVGGVAKWFGIAGEGGARNTARITTKVLVLTAAMAPLSLAVIGLTSLMRGLAQVAVGAAKVVGNAFAIAGKGAGGILAVIGKRVPKFGAFLGKMGGFLGKAGKLTERAVAQPVRVVNFNEAGLAGRAGAALGPSGAREIALGTATERATAAVGNFRGGLNNLAGRVPKVGSLLTRNLTNVAGAATSLGGKLGSAGLVGAAGALGFAFGTLIDRTFGLSKRISTFFADRTKDERKMVTDRLDFVAKEVSANRSAAATLKQLIQMQQAGIKVMGPGGQKKEVTQEAARARLVEQLKRQQLTQAQQTTILANMSVLLGRLPKAGTTRPPTPVKPAKDALVSSTGFLPVSAGDVVLDRASLASALISGNRGALVNRSLEAAAPEVAAATGRAPQEVRIEVPVQVDGRQIALAVAAVKLDDLERSGASVAAGQRSALLQRGFEEAT
jgi:TP901 family phage tail tape measure protein